MSQRLLILDDDPSISATIAMIAEDAGFESSSTSDPEEFFRLVEEWQPSHIALDLVMPQMDGVQVMTRLSKQGCETKIIITSGVGSRVLDAAARSAVEHGLVIAGILSKPFTPAALRTLLQRDKPQPEKASFPGVTGAPQRPDGEFEPDDLRQAILKGQLVLAYQPQVAIDGRQLAGFEALVRWQHPTLGLVMPDRFIPLAESCGLIDELTDAVFEMGLAWLASLFPAGTQGETGITLSVNISATSLGDRDFVEDALAACERHGIDPGRVVLEITESSAMRDPTATLDQLTRVRMKGFQLSIDDFGTGYSSMLQLARLPFSELKVDKSFVMSTLHSMESRAVVRSIIELGSSLGLRTVAEGIEDAATLEFLSSIGCGIAQGYFIARPLPGDAAAEWATARGAPGPATRKPEPGDTNAGPIESFQWTAAFLTGIDEVDQQHKRLVDMINQLGAMLLSGEQASTATANELFAQLVDYTSYHFREEEGLMEELALDPRHVDFHRAEHAKFVAEVIRMRESVVDQSSGGLAPVLAFLVHWLAYHILGVDQSMARQVAMIRRHNTPGDAFSSELEQINGATEPLVRALHGLLRLISQKNEELRENNRMLETRVAERTEALGEANRQLAAIAMTDALTGIPNRRHALSMIKRAWDESQADDRPLACLMVDADYLKRVNDSHGHDAGDEVIKSAANQLRDAARSDDIVCRLGGDEFIVIAPTTPLEGALQLAEKIRHAVSNLRVATGDGEWEGSVSIGVAVRDSSMESPEALIKAADDAVYLAKAAGRNCVASSDGAVPGIDRGS